MKYSYRPTTSNLILAVVFLIIIAFLNFRIYGFESYTIGMVIGTLSISLIISFLFAIIVWFLKGKQYKGGSTTFNIVIVIIFLGSISEFQNIISDRKEPIDEIGAAVKKFKKSAKEKESTYDEDVDQFTNNIQGSLDKLIKTSVGDERKLYLIIKQYHVKMDSINTEWNLAHEKLMDPKVLDFNSLEDEKNYDFHLSVIDQYVNQSKEYKRFFENRMDYLNQKFDALNSNNESIKGFKKGFAKKDSIQQPVFQEYLNSHISYGQNLKDIIELLEQNDGNWKMVNEELIFQNSRNQDKYDEILFLAIENEEKVNFYSDKILEVM